EYFCQVWDSSSDHPHIF
nr:immunoglobulin light chain junction region [Macaca mulatta]MOV98769.1 immunoglobulin light chain junction region [Macaca mulatta]MOV99352.1 immunoglobulin light chain junction region [Macaca mulatta]